MAILFYFLSVTTYIRKFILQLLLLDDFVAAPVVANAP